MAKVNGKVVPDYSYIKQLLPETDQEDEANSPGSNSDMDTTLIKMDTITSQDMDFEMPGEDPHQKLSEKILFKKHLG